MRIFGKFYAILIAALILIMVSGAFAQQTINNSTLQQQTTQAQMQPFANGIVLVNNPLGFHRYNTNGAVSDIIGNSGMFFGANTTDMYSDIVSYQSINADKTLVLHVDLSVNISIFSNTAEDQFAVFATDDIIRYKLMNLGFLCQKMEEPFTLMFSLLSYGSSLYRNLFWIPIIWNPTVTKQSIITKNFRGMSIFLLMANLLGAQRIQTFQANISI
jgi:hypothetical protein